MPFDFRRALMRVVAPVERLLRRRRRPWKLARASFDHAVWLARRDADDTPLSTPPISLIVPVYDTPTRYLDELVASVRGQRPGSWRLILSDDGSKSEATRAWLDAHAADADLTIVRNPVNGGIVAATNAGIAVATTPWIGFLDHDDALAPYALDRVVRALDAHPECRFLYTDEVVADDRLRPLDLFLKPAFDPVLLAGVNYVNHLSLYRRDRLLEIGALRPGFDGSQDYDLLLRYTAGLGPGECLHLPYPAYLWRRDGASFSARHLDRATAAARRALAEAHRRPHREVEVEGAVNPDLHRVRFDLDRDEWPLVSVVIPNRDAFELISQVLEGLIEKTDYPSLEIVVSDNGTTDPRVLALYESRAAGPVPFRAEIHPEPFNFSRSTNRGIALSKGSLILLLNNDIEVLEPNWLKEMVSCFDWPDTAIVGAKLLYPDRRIQHAGVIAGFGGLAGHWYIGQHENFPGPMGRLWVRQSMSVVTGACMLVSRAAFDRVGLLDEKDFAIAYNDVDLCLRAVAAGMRVVWTPFATLIHHESASRGSDETPANIERFRREQANLRRHHATDRYEDRALNPWYSKGTSTPAPIGVDHLPEAR
ncbi:MAG: glycosyltransferase [Phyllobacteriaceae bacterium]|nr:glycosyltransferase [Phyllobacteriaceae bacterium]